MAEKHTERDWIEYAGSCCWKRVDLSVNMSLALRGMAGWRKWREAGGDRPPWKVPERRLHLDWREMFGTRERARRARRARIEAAARGVCASRSRAAGGVCDSGNGAEGGMCDGEQEAARGVCDRDPDLELAAEDAENGLPESLPSPFGRLVKLSFSAPASVKKRFRAALRATRHKFGHHLDDGECVHRMLIHLANTHVTPEVEERMARYVVAETFRWVCASPNCCSYGPFHNHHRHFRSRGGGDELWNLVLMCDRCHELLHEGKMVIRGRSPDGLVFLFGLRPDGTAREAYREGIRVPELEVSEESVRRWWTEWESQEWARQERP